MQSNVIVSLSAMCALILPHWLKLLVIVPCLFTHIATSMQAQRGRLWANRPSKPPESTHHNSIAIRAPMATKPSETSCHLAQSNPIRISQHNCNAERFNIDQINVTKIWMTSVNCNTRPQPQARIQRVAKILMPIPVGANRHDGGRAPSLMPCRVMLSNMLIPI